MAKANAEGRDSLNDSELDQAWSAFKWNAPAGSLEALGAEGIALKLFKNLDRGTGGAFSRGWIHLFKEAGKGAAREAAQESVQTAWMNMVAAEVAKYDDNRKLYEGVVRAGGAGGVIGALFGGVMGSVNRKAEQQRRIASLNDLRERLIKGGNIETANAVGIKLQSEMMSMEEDIDFADARRKVIEATDEWRAKQELISKQNYEAMLNAQTSDWIENEDGTITIPLSDGWSVQTTKPATREEVYGPRVREYEDVEVYEENLGGQLKLEKLDRRLAKAMDSLAEVEGLGEETSGIEAEIDKIQAEINEISNEDGTLKEPILMVKARLPKRIQRDFEFAVRSPSGTTFGPMEEGKAYEFVSQQQSFIDDTADKIRDMEDAEIDALIEQIEANEAEKAQYDLTTAEEQRERGKVSDEEMDKMRKQQEEELQSLSTAMSAIGMTATEQENYRGGDVVSVGDPKSGERYEVIQGRIGVEIEEGKMLVRNLKTGEETQIEDSGEIIEVMQMTIGGRYVTTPAAVTSVAEVAETGIDPEPLRQPDYRWTPEASKLVQDNKDIYGLIDPSGDMKVESGIVPEDGMNITVTDVRNWKVRQMRVEKMRQAQAESMKFFPTFGEGKGVSETISPEGLRELDKVNAARRERGVKEITIQDVLRTRELANAEIDARNQIESNKASEANRKKTKAAKDKAKKNQEELQKKIEQINHLRFYRGQDPISAKEVDIDSIGIPDSKKQKAERLQRLTGLLNAEDVSSTDAYLREKVEGEGVKRNVEPKATGESEVTFASELTGRVRGAGRVRLEGLTPIEGKAHGHRYRAYVKGDNVFYSNVELHPVWTSGKETTAIIDNELNQLFVIELDTNAEKADQTLGTFDKPLSKTEAKLAIQELEQKSKGSYRVAFVSLPKRVQYGSDLKSRKKNLHKLMQSKVVSNKVEGGDARQVPAAGFLDNDGKTTLITLRTEVSQVGTLIQQTPAESEATQKQKRLKELEERKEAKAQARITNARGEVVKIVAGKTKAYTKEDIDVANAFNEEVLDHIVSGGRYHGLKFDGIVLSKPDAGYTTAGEAVWVREDAPNNIYINPKALGKHFKIEKGLLVPKDKNGRSVESVVREELSHMMDLQAINYLIKNNKVKAASVKTFLESIYNLLSPAQRESVVTDYMGHQLTEPVVDAEAGVVTESPKPDETGLRKGSLSKSQIAMEALRMIRSGSGLVNVETEEAAKSKLPFFNLFKGVREFFGATKKEGQTIAPAIKAYMEATEQYLVIQIDKDSKENYTRVGTFLSAEADQKFVYVESTIQRDDQGKPKRYYFNATNQGRRDAVEFVKQEEIKKGNSEPLSDKDAMLRVKGGASVSFIRFGYDASIEGQRDRFNKHRQKARMLQALQSKTFDRYPPSASVMKDIDEINSQITTGQKIDNWGTYAQFKAIQEANKVWGANASSELEGVRTHTTTGKSSQAESEGEVESISHAAGELDAPAAEWYERHIITNVYKALVNHNKLRPIYFNDDPSVARRKSRIFEEGEEGLAEARRQGRENLRSAIAQYAADREGGDVSQKGEARADFIDKFKVEGSGYGAVMVDGKVVIREGVKMTNKSLADFVRKNMVVDSQIKASENGRYNISIASHKSNSKLIEYATGFKRHWHSQKRDGTWRRSIKSGQTDEDSHSDADVDYDQAEIIMGSIHDNMMTQSSEFLKDDLQTRLETYEENVEIIESVGEPIPDMVFETWEDAQSWWSAEIKKGAIKDTGEIVVETIEDGKTVLVEQEREGVDVTPNRPRIQHRVEETPVAGKWWETETRGKPAPETESEYRFPLKSEPQEVEVPLKPILVEERSEKLQYKIVGATRPVRDLSDVKLTSAEEYIYKKFIHPEARTVRTPEQVADAIEYLLEQGNAEVVARVEAKEIPMFTDNQGMRRVLQTLLMQEFLSAQRKINQLNEAAANGNPETYGANLHEQPDSPQSVATNPNTSSDVINQNSPVVDKSAKLGVDWKSPSSWFASATDSLKKMGLDRLASAVDDYYRERDIVQGAAETGLRVIKEGGVEMVNGKDQNGIKRDGMFFDTAKQAEEWAKENGWDLKDVYYVRHEGYGSRELQKASFEVREYYALHEASGSDATVEEKRAIAKYFLENKASKAAVDMIKWIRSNGRTSGYMLEENNVLVNDEGTWRPITNLYEEHFPRVFKQRTWEVIHNPVDNAEEYNRMLEAMVEGGAAANKHKADKILQGYIQNINDVATGGDFFANIEKARGFKLPDEFYDYSVDAYMTYIRRFSDRIAQIKAFGQGKKGTKTMWDKTIDAYGRGKKNIEFLKNLRSSITRSYGQDDSVMNFLSRVGLPASAVTMLSGPLTSIRNTAFALRANAESFGTVDTLVVATKQLMDVVQTNVKSVSEGKGLTSSSMADAANLNMLRHDFVTGQMLASSGDDVRVGPEEKYREKMKTAQKWGLWMMRVTENFNRSVTATMAMQHLRKTRELWATDPDGKDTAKHMAMLNRLGYGQEKLAKLMKVDKDGNWEPDSRQLKEYIMDMTNEKQYGYNVRQHPLWMDNPSARILFQFQKWGFQRTRDFGKNVVMPALVGTKVTLPDGTVKENVRDTKMLYRNAFLMMGMGELYATLLRGLFYDKEREEFVVPMSERNESIMLGASERIVRNLTYDGGFGIIGDYINWAAPLDTRPRKWKSPLPTEPPTWSLATSSLSMAKDIGYILQEDTQMNAKTEAVLAAMERYLFSFSLPRTFEGLSYTTQRALGIESYGLAVQDGRKDARLLRAAARDFAKANGYEDSRVWSGEKPVMSEKRFLYNSLNEALLAGDYEKARVIRDRMIGDKTGKERRAVISGMKASVRSRQPILLDGRQPDSKAQREFLRWVAKELPEYEERIDRVHETYWKAARRAGLK